MYPINTYIQSHIVIKCTLETYKKELIHIPQKRKYKRMCVKLVIMLSILITMFTYVGADTEYPPNPGITGPGRIVQGQIIYFKGCEFDQSSVTIKIYGSDKTIVGEFTANVTSDGWLYFSWDVPLNASIGLYTIVVSEDQKIITSRRFEVLDSPTISISKGIKIGRWVGIKLYLFDEEPISIKYTQNGNVTTLEVPPPRAETYSVVYSDYKTFLIRRKMSSGGYLSCSFLAYHIFGGSVPVSITGKVGGVTKTFSRNVSIDPLVEPIVQIPNNDILQVGMDAHIFTIGFNGTVNLIIKKNATLVQKNLTLIDYLAYYKWDTHDMEVGDYSVICSGMDLNGSRKAVTSVIKLNEVRRLEPCDSFISTEEWSLFLITAICIVTTFVGLKLFRKKKLFHSTKSKKKI